MAFAKSYMCPVCLSGARFGAHIEAHQKFTAITYCIEYLLVHGMQGILSDVSPPITYMGRALVPTTLVFRPRRVRRSRE